MENKMTVSFDYFLPEVMEPHILTDFNKNSHMDGVDKQGYIPMYQTHSLKFGEFKDYRTKAMKKIDKNLDGAAVDIDVSDPIVLGNGNGLVGAPFITIGNDGNYKLRWKSLNKNTIKSMMGLI